MFNFNDHIINNAASTRFFGIISHRASDQHNLLSLISFWIENSTHTTQKFFKPLKAITLTFNPKPQKNLQNLGSIKLSAQNQTFPLEATDKIP